MNTFVWTVIGTTLCISLLVLVQGNAPSNAKNNLHVVCTTTFLHDALKQIGGSKLTITPLMNPGVDPHLYKPTEQDMQRIAEADLVVYHGLHLEGKMAELFKHMNTYRPTIAACDGLLADDLKKTDIAHVYDPHIWFSIPLWKKVVRHLENMLCTHDPHNAAHYHEHAQTYCTRLDNLHAYALQQLATIPIAQRIMITAHDAFEYFGITYGFRVLGLQGISTDADIGTAGVEQLAQFIVDHDVSTIFTELSIPPKSIQVLQQSVARHHKKVAIGPELYTDSLGDENSSASTYESMMRYTIDVLVHAFQPKEKYGSST